MAKKEKERIVCPCCKYKTLSEESSYEICPICFWEDDGHPESIADKATGGPNHHLSLTQARYNFARLGAVDWTSIVHVDKEHIDKFARENGFPFLDVERITNLPPTDNWNLNYSTISYHPKYSDISTRWKSMVKFCLDQGFEFQGVYEFKDYTKKNWASPNVLWKIEYEKNVDIMNCIQSEEKLIVAAWFHSSDKKRGLFAYFGHIWEPVNYNDKPANIIRLFQDSKISEKLFDNLINVLNPLIAVNSSSRWEMGPLTDINRQAFIYGENYLSSELSTEENIKILKEFCGTENVIQFGEGYKFHTMFKELSKIDYKIAMKREREDNIFLSNFLQKIQKIDR